MPTLKESMLEARSGASGVWPAEYANFTLNWASRGWSALHCMHASHHAMSLKIHKKKKCIQKENVLSCLLEFCSFVGGLGGLTCFCLFLLLIGDALGLEQNRWIFQGAHGRCCKVLAVIHQRRAFMRKIEKIGGSKRVEMEKMVSLNRCAWAMESLAR